MPKSEKIKIIAQASGMKNLKIEGGWRLTLDLYESRLQDIMTVAALVNSHANLSVTLEPVKDEGDKND